MSFVLGWVDRKLDRMTGRFASEEEGGEMVYEFKRATPHVEV